MPEAFLYPPKPVLNFPSCSNRYLFQFNNNVPLKTNANQKDLEATLATLKTCGILAILRAKNADLAIERGIELCKMGCRAIEVTLDTVSKTKASKCMVASLMLVSHCRRIGDGCCASWWSSFPAPSAWESVRSWTTQSKTWWK